MTTNGNMTTAHAPLIDEFLPTYDVHERHRISIRASQSAVYDAIATTDLADSSLVRVLLFVRALPAALGHGLEGMRWLLRHERAPTTLASLRASGFHILAERRPEEIVLGIEGKFWTPEGAECTRSIESFKEPIAPGMARGIWDFRVVATSPGVVELSTETRVACADAATRRRFLPYWVVIRAGSGLIRHAMLRAIKTTAEQEAQR
jgi:hypothetical protein